MKDATLPSHRRPGPRWVFRLWVSPFKRWGHLTITGVFFSLLIVVALACGNVSAQPPPTFVKTIGTNTATTSGTSISITVPAAGVAQGNTIIVALATSDATGAVSCSDTQSNTYSVDASIINTKGIRTAICSAYVATALVSGNTITFSHPSVEVRAVSANEFSGIVSSGRVDKTSTNTGKDLNLTSGSTTTTSQNIEVLFGAFSVLDKGDRTFTPGTNYTVIGAAGIENRDIFPEARFVSATGTYAATGTLSGSREYAGAIVTYKAVLTTAVDLVSVTAITAGEGVLLRWQTGYEIDNLGFHLYREGNRGPTRLTPGILGGSALLAGGGTPLTAGWSYQWWDPGGSLDDLYWLQDVDLNGERGWHGPVAVQAASTRAVVSERGRGVDAPLLSRLGMKDPGQRAVSERRQRRAAASKKTQTQLDTQWDLAAQPGVKIGIDNEAWYRLEQPELQRAGLAPQVDPRRLQLFVEGQEVPIVVTGAEDGSFDYGDAIEFHGMGLDTPWTGTRIYWLVEGPQPGKRVPLVASANPGRVGTSPTSFPFTLELAEQSIYVPSLRRGEGENFFGSVITTELVEQVFEVHHLDPASAQAPHLEVALQGFSAQSHLVTILFNAVELETLRFDEQSWQKTEISLPPGLLREGTNRLTLISRGGESDVSLLDFIRLTYSHTYTADQEILFFSVPALPEKNRWAWERMGIPRRVTVGGFNSPSIRVMDFSHPTGTQELTGSVERQGEGYAVSFSLKGSESHQLMAFSETGSRRPKMVLSNQPSEWHHAPEAEILILTHRDFLEDTRPLAAFRESQGWTVALIDIEDLYDEFNFGHKSPWALRDYLSWTFQHWQAPAEFVLLVGDATFDPRNHTRLGDFDFLPTKLVNTTAFESASDDWFADLDEDGVPEMAIGRLPVRTEQQAAALVSKIVGYEQSGQVPGSGWVLLVTDRNEGFDFETASDRVGELIPPGLGIERVARSQDSDPVTRAELLQKLDQGPLLVNYLGHGSVDVWAGGLLTSADASGIRNGSRLFVLISMTCLNGAFHVLVNEGLAESLLAAPEGGAVAAWASSGLVDPSGQAIMNQALMPLLFQGMTLGEAARRAKASVEDPDIRRSWILLGDPVTRLNDR